MFSRLDAATYKTSGGWRVAKIDIRWKTISYLGQGSAKFGQYDLDRRLPKMSSHMYRAAV